MEVHSLASGSSGNSILIKHGRTSLLIDAGIGIRKLSAALIGLKVNPQDLSAILITHEHSDHISGAFRMANRYAVPLVANQRTLHAMHGTSKVPHQVLGIGEEAAFGPLSVRAFPVRHDAVQPSGYTISAKGGACVCYVTDTGILTDRIRSESVQADLLILESNHDVRMLESGPYPWHLKKRILSDRGHLSNDTAAEFVREIAESGATTAVWLAHLSKTNNTPWAALNTTQKQLAECPGHGVTVEVAKRDVPSLAWRHRSRVFQLSLFSPGR